MAPRPFKNTNPKKVPKQDPPPPDPLACEADSTSNHDITIVSLLDEVVIVCDTCHDEIGATLDEVTLDEILRCVDIHVNGPPDIDCVTLPDGSCIADPCRLHDPRPKKTDPPCTGHPSTHDCTCTNGIGCINVPYEDW